ncbi:MULTISPECIES: quinolinate synthase NadA [Fusobacterium]|uniref:quinolinate synthase NadA n=1 Tax=Fusobacterium TaxID=848 RepID=UPI001F48B8FA|nr:MULTISPECIES: quinolinate synthase NadA [Fusobacterium]MCF2612525.1 quinolinate synthase NadA [Fusobacterium perfoetens]MDY2980497.1 quinolinate synthase NadA [Fusobacterium sp.]
MENKFEKIKKLKEEKDAIILAHYYTEPEVQKIADYVGDSYFLSEKAREVKEKVIVMCGVSFMGESVKLLNKDKIVLLPDMSADCPMAHMATVEKIKEMREKYEDLAVVCYVNSTAELKAHSDVCVTSANALKIAERLPNKNIFFIPDQHLARYISTKLPEKNFIFNEGWCPIHNELTKEELLKAKEKYPNAKVAIHPECPIETVELGDYVGSTSGIIKYVTESDAEEFIICTEDGVLYELQEKNPNKKFYLPKEKFQCVGMKKITLDKIINSLETLEPQVHLKDEIITEANKPLENMLEMAK